MRQRRDELVETIRSAVGLLGAQELRDALGTQTDSREELSAWAASAKRGSTGDSTALKAPTRTPMDAGHSPTASCRPPRCRWRSSGVPFLRLSAPRQDGRRGGGRQLVMAAIRALWETASSVGCTAAAPLAIQHAPISGERRPPDSSTFCAVSTRTPSRSSLAASANRPGLDPRSGHRDMADRRMSVARRAVREPAGKLRSRSSPSLVGTRRPQNLIADATAILERGTDRERG